MQRFAMCTCIMSECNEWDVRVLHVTGGCFQCAANCSNALPDFML